MRISDWSSDVCSSDLGSVCAFHLDRLLRRSLQPPLRVTLGYISSGQAAGILDVSSGISRTQRQFDLVQARAVALLVLLPRSRSRRLLGLAVVLLRVSQRLLLRCAFRCCPAVLPAKIGRASWRERGG